MRPLVLLACSALLLLLSPALPARAATDEDVNRAVDRGVAWVKGKQEPDGAFRCRWASSYKSGETALALLALLKGGVAPDDPAIERGFRWLLEQPHQRIYEVSLAILALEARYTPPPAQSVASSDPLATQIRDRFKRFAFGRDRDWLAGAVNFLVTHQHESGLWRYPFHGEADVSNAQFAILALKAAVRMGVRVPPEVWLRVTSYLLEKQEQEGPEVPSFEVPAADQAIAGLLDRRARQREREERARAGRSGRDGSRTRDEPEAAEGTRTRTAMRARGWGYAPGHGPRGSMTAAGLAILVAAKSELEEHPRWADKLGPMVDQSLRDGAAWLATRFRVDRHPGAEPDWIFYYLYTLERAGSLLALDRFGGRDWYREGADFILSCQQGDGRFTCDTGGETDGELAGTCLAILFLERSTVPVIKRVRTGDAGPAAGSGTSASGPTVSRRADGQLEVHFRLQAGPGKRVALAGSWNGWSADGLLLADPEGDGTYEARVTLPAGRHTYKFVVDGAWQPDPANERSEPDGFGGRNSIVEG